MPKLKDNTHLTKAVKMPTGWVRNMIEGVHTQEEWRKIVRGLPPQVKVQFLLASQPKEIKGEMTNTLRLVIEGFKPAKEIQAQVIQELEAHEDDVDES